MYRHELRPARHAGAVCWTPQRSILYLKACLASQGQPASVGWHGSCTLNLGQGGRGGALLPGGLRGTLPAPPRAGGLRATHARCAGGGVPRRGGRPPGRARLRHRGSGDEAGTARPALG